MLKILLNLIYLLKRGMNMSILNKTDLKIPTHLAIILDGNGRWALKRHLKRTMGHKVGAETMREIIDYSFSLGVKVLSLYCFSTENWKRDKEEVDYLFTLPIIYFDKYIDSMVNKGIKVIFSGDISKLPNKTMLACDKALLKTKNCNKYILNICLNYGSHDEIVRACKLIANEVENKQISINDINEKTIQDHLYSKNLPNIDFLIRTSNEKRLSNFMLWQASYAELYFTKTLWPAFTKRCLIKALKDYSKRDRRFGGVKK